MLAARDAERIQNDAEWEARLLRAFRLMPEAAKGMMVKVAESYEREPLELISGG